MNTNEVHWFRSKIDWSLGAIIVAVPLLQLTLVLSAIMRRDADATFAGLASVGFVAAIYGLLVMPVRYGITDEALLVHFGLIRQRIQFDAIREVRPSRSPLSSPALSLDRLAIKTGSGPLHLTLISPVDREEFLRELSSKAGLGWDGERWVKRR